MTDEFQLRRELDEARRAKNVHDQVSPAIEAIKNTLREKWENSAADDTEGREHVWRMLKSLKELDRYYLKRIKTGQLAETKLKERNRNG